MIELSEYKIHQMKVFLTSKCSLKCEFCLNSKINIRQIEAEVETVIKHIDYILSMDVHYIELGVLIGDSLEYDISKLKYIIQYLDNNDKVYGISISTSFLFFSQEILDIFNITSKLNIQISWYGFDNNSYFKNTKIKNSYNKFINNIKLLQNLKTKIHFTIIKMFKSNQFKDIYNNEIIKTFKNVLNDHSILEIDESATKTNWSKMIEQKNKIIHSTKRGPCMYLFYDSGIDNDNNVLACAWFDYNKSIILGNTEIDTPKQVILNHNKIINEHKIGLLKGICSTCKIYDPIKLKGKS